MCDAMDVDTAHPRAPATMSYPQRLSHALSTSEGEHPALLSDLLRERPSAIFTSFRKDVAEARAAAQRAAELRQRLAAQRGATSRHTAAAAAAARRSSAPASESASTCSANRDALVLNTPRSELLDTEQSKTGFEEEERMLALCGKTPLHVAVSRFGEAPYMLRDVLQVISEEAVKAECEQEQGVVVIEGKSCSIDVSDDDGFSPIAHAVKADLAEAVSLLIEAGADLTREFCVLDPDRYRRVPGNGASLLSWAIYCEARSAFNALISGGADVAAWDRNAMRPVHTAALVGDLDVLRELLARDGALNGEMSPRHAASLYVVREKFLGAIGPDLDDDEDEDDDDDDHNHHHHHHAPADRASDANDVDVDAEIRRHEFVDVEGLSDGASDLDDDHHDALPSSHFRIDQDRPDVSREFYRTMTGTLDTYDLEQRLAALDTADEAAAAEAEHTAPAASATEDDVSRALSRVRSLGAASESININLETMEIEVGPGVSDAVSMALTAAANGPNDDNSSASPAPPLFIGQADGRFVRVDSAPQALEQAVLRTAAAGAPDADNEDRQQRQMGQAFTNWVLKAILRAIEESRRPFAGCNLLHLATTMGKHEAIKFLLGPGRAAQNIEDRQTDGATALLIAASNNDTEAMRILLDPESGPGANVNVRSDTDSSTVLMKAAKAGHTDVVKLLLRHGARVHDEDDDGLTALHASCACKDGAEIVAALVDAGAAVNAQTLDGRTAAYEAVAHGNFEVFRKLLELGADPSIPNEDGSVPVGFVATKDLDELSRFAKWVSEHPDVKERMNMNIHIGQQGETALHIAASDGNADAVENLLKAGADPDPVNDDSYSPLLLATRPVEMPTSSRVRIVKALLEAGASATRSDDEGKQAIHFATYTGETECVKLLLEHGANPSAATEYKTPLHLCALENHADVARLLVKANADINAADDTAMTPLMYAALKHSVSVLKVLVEGGADLSAIAHGKMTALHISAAVNHPDAPQTVSTLLAAGAPTDVMDENGMCPIHLFVDFRRIGCLRVMLQAGVDPNMRSKVGFTPLIRACNLRQSKTQTLMIMRLLLRFGADVNARNKNGNTVMSYLGDTDEHGLIRVMLNAGADINVRDLQGDTPLHEAAMGNHGDTAALLVRRGADINAQNDKKETALYIAADRGHTQVVRALLTKHANAHAQVANSQGITPYQVARRNGHDEITKLLLDAMDIRLSKFAPLSLYDIKSPRQSVDATTANNTVTRRDSGRTLCVTCQEALVFGEEIRTLPCGHVFHDPCILPWVGGEKMTKNRTCPVCKQLVAPTDV